MKDEKTDLTVEKIFWTQPAEYLLKAGNVRLVEKELLPKAFWFLLFLIFLEEGLV